LATLCCAMLMFTILTKLISEYLLPPYDDQADIELYTVCCSSLVIHGWTTKNCKIITWTPHSEKREWCGCCAIGLLTTHNGKAGKQEGIKLVAEF